jgi:hypothetical protein
MSLELLQAKRAQRTYALMSLFFISEPLKLAIGCHEWMSDTAYPNERTSFLTVRHPMEGSSRDVRGRL